MGNAFICIPGSLSLPKKPMGEIDGCRLGSYPNGLQDVAKTCLIKLFPDLHTA